MKIVALMVADVDWTKEQAVMGAQVVQHRLRDSFSDIFGGAVSVRIGLDEATEDELIQSAKEGIAETKTRMATGDFTTRQFIETPQGRKDIREVVGGQPVKES